MNRLGMLGVLLGFAIACATSPEVRPDGCGAHDGAAGACCGAAGCEYLRAHGRCVLEERLCRSDDECPSGTRCEDIQEEPNMMGTACVAAPIRSPSPWGICTPWN